MDFGSVHVNAEKLYGNSKGAGLPVDGPLEQELATPVYRSEGDGMNAFNTPEATLLIYEKLREMQDMLRNQRLGFDATHPVDEYSSTLGVPATVNWTDGNVSFATYLEVTRTWDIPERIESILACIPVGATQAVLKLGDRWINLYQGAALTASLTVSLVAPMGMILSQDDERILLLNGTLTAGPTHIEIMGWADDLYGCA